MRCLFSRETIWGRGRGRGRGNNSRQRGQQPTGSSKGFGSEKTGECSQNRVTVPQQAPNQPLNRPSIGPRTGYDFTCTLAFSRREADMEFVTRQLASAFSSIRWALCSSVSGGT